jgi:hypothetical protein
MIEKKFVHISKMLATYMPPGCNGPEIINEEASKAGTHSIMCTASILHYFGIRFLFYSIYCYKLS